MSPSDFKYRVNFPSLSDMQIQDGIDAVETEWYGALSLWQSLPADIRTKKQTLLENYLLAWYLANTNPFALKGVTDNSGLPLSSKSIGGVSVSFKTPEVEGSLQQLQTNIFGMHAISMIQSAPERFQIYGN